MNRDKYYDDALLHVLDHAYFSNAKVKPDKPYMVRWPLSSGQVMQSDDTMQLVEMVAQKMRDAKKE